MKTPRYHYLNPQIYKAFKEVAFMIINKGHKTYSSKGIIELVRFAMGAKAGNDQFEINNNYTSFYARKFMDDNPQRKGFFEVRPSKFD